ncbi:apolipoprotein N-acyltransferase [Actinomadura rupiterrae]|uniref:apolipoprotein N-acyltransferase n=1 Tax=Actinomadura rupiterrae TaxID=559627 RepID=UPI0020A25E00|nr:apolipoprotein N-acyltransferase [Actinomadura rupiterrae]MCP2335715.1 apolipoprotein N-acyltransferase [Actinomadura rupiterrae]
MAGAVPILTFPRADLGWLAWVALVPGMLLMVRARTRREAAARGWAFGAGYLLAALYWTVPYIGPGLPLIAVVFGALWAPWGVAARALIPGRPVSALLILPSAWVTIELVRSRPALGGPWAVYGATQWQHPTELSLAALGGIWLISFALVAANTALTLALATLHPRSSPQSEPTAPTPAPEPATPEAASASPPPPNQPVTGPFSGGSSAKSKRMFRAGMVILFATLVSLGPLTFAARAGPPTARTMRITLVQPGMVNDAGTRLADEFRLTADAAPADLTVWGESSVGVDLDRDPALVARFRELAATRGPLLVNVDAADARGRITKSAVLVGTQGVQARYTKTRLVPFGEYIPFRRAFGWLSGISKAAGQNRVPGTGPTVMKADGTTFGPLICFESAFPDLGRALVERGAGLIVYQSATSSFQNSWAPPQHASLGAVRAAETGRPVVQAALTGVSAAYDPRGRRLAWFDTDRRGTVTVTLPVPPTTTRTPYDRVGDVIPLGCLIATSMGIMGAVWKRRTRARGSGVMNQQ